MSSHYELLQAADSHITDRIEKLDYLDPVQLSSAAAGGPIEEKSCGSSKSAAPHVGLNPRLWHLHKLARRPANGSSTGWSEQFNKSSHELEAQLKFNHLCSSQLVRPVAAVIDASLRLQLSNNLADRRELLGRSL